MCSYFGVTRQAYYKGLKRQVRDTAAAKLIVDMVMRIRRENKCMGGKKLYRLLRREISELDSSFGRDKFFDLLRQQDLLVKRRRKYAVTTHSRHRFRIYRNLLEEFVPTAPHQAWVCDITYIRVKQGFCYLFLITDAYSRKIVGWDLNKSLGMEGALQSLSIAIKQCSAPEGLIHHSDRGFQYCCPKYTAILKAKGIAISMAEAGNCYQNAMAERVNGILKGEYGLDETFADEKQARQAAREGIRAYNEQRPHWSLGLEIPENVHHAA